jgi:metallo-beta-lactamase class B
VGILKPLDQGNGALVLLERDGDTCLKGGERNVTMKRMLCSAVVAAMLLIIATPIYAQPRPGIPSDTEGMYQALKKAREIAAWDLFPYYAHRCVVDQTYRQTISRGVQASNPIEPLKIFDNVYFVGQNAVSSFIIKTSAGLIVFDTLNSPDEAKTYIVGGMQKLGLNPADIKYVFISHSHGDHYAGAQYLKDTYGAKLVASKIDWAVMDKSREEAAKTAANPAPKPAAPAQPGQPARRTAPRWSPPTHDATDISIDTDGQKWVVGDTTFTLYITPPHAPGVLSPIFNVYDHGVKHVAAVYGGLGTPASEEDKKIHIAQLARYMQIAKAAGVDVLLSTHQTQDQAIWKLEELRLRHPGDPNPYVIGADRYQRYLRLQQACTEYAAAQQGQNIK